MLRLGCVTLVLATGCRGLFGLEDPSTATDGGIGGSDAGQVCFGTDVRVCIDPPKDAITNLSGILMTDTEGRCIAAGNACVIAGTDITIPAGTMLDARGTKPLILLASGVLAIDGTLDASSHRGGKAGPAAMATCAAGTAPSKHGGGAGGSFGAQGGGGGGNADGDTGGTPGAASPAGFRGGCNGQNAGTVTMNTFGIGGAGGGVVYLIAGSKLLVGGVVNASGAGGNAGQCTPATCTLNSGMDANGGGGGGSGGLIVLEAPAITLAPAAHVFADGGGGGEGGSHSANGGNGSDPDGITGGAGGAELSNGGDGGRGAHDLAIAAVVGANGAPGQDSTAGAAGGGGGGGSAGVIRVHSTTFEKSTAIVSPAVTP